MLLRKRKIILIEDNFDQAEIYKKELETFGYEVVHTANAEEALDLIEKENPSLVLLDLMLGNSSGLDILEKIKSDPATKSIKVIALTNFKEKELLENNRLEGIYAYIFKPDYTPKEMVRKITEYLE